MVDLELKKGWKIIKEELGIYLSKDYCSSCGWVISPHSLLRVVSICPECGEETHCSVGRYRYRIIKHWLWGTETQILGFVLKNDPQLKRVNCEDVGDNNG